VNPLRITMAKKGLQTRELSHMSGVSERTISRLINGHGNPTYDTAYSLADALNVHVNKLFPDLDYHRIKKNRTS